MDNARIKVKIGQHEFEAEGPAEMVQGQFDAFKQIIATLPEQPTKVKTDEQPPLANNAETSPDIQLDKICRADGRIVSLTVKPDSEAVASMLIMLGQKNYRENDTPTASEIKDGLEQSGYRIERVDRVVQPLAEEGSIIKLGARKGTRYRFTNQGIAKAISAAREAISRVSQP